MIEDLRLGDVMEIVGALRGKPTSDAVPVDHGMAIVVLDRGFVYVGRAATDRDWCVIRDAANVRYWGTTKGLGQLASEGPTANTKLDTVGLIRAPMRAVISIIPVQEGPWKGKF